MNTSDQSLMRVPSIVNPRAQCFAWADPSGVSALACGPEVSHHLSKRAAVFVESNVKAPRRQMMKK